MLGGLKLGGVLFGSLYGGDLKDTTATFLELADAARRVEGDFILDGEILAMRGERVLPFAELQKRLGRREDDFFLREEVPVRFIAFDLLWLNGETQLDHPLRQRIAALDRQAMPAAFRLAPSPLVIFTYGITRT